MGCIYSTAGDSRKKWCCRPYCARSDDSPHTSHYLLTGTPKSSKQPSRPEIGKSKDNSAAAKNGGHRQFEIVCNSSPFKLSSSVIKVLLVFCRTDACAETWRRVCVQRGYDVTLVTWEDVDSVDSETHFDLVLIDARATQKYSPEKLVTNFKSSGVGSLTLNVAIVKKRDFKEDYHTVSRFVYEGFHKVIPETKCSATISNCIHELVYSELAFLKQEEANKVLLNALDSSRDVVHITDNQHHILHVNKVCESVLGYNLEEVRGKTIWELHGSELHKYRIRAPSDSKSMDESRGPAADMPRRSSLTSKSSVEKCKEVKCVEPSVMLDVSEAVNLQMRRNRSWEGFLTFKRKNSDVINLTSKVTPVFGASTGGDYYVYWSDGKTGERNEILQQRGSLKSNRKSSGDIRSNSSTDDRRSSIIRRQVYSSSQTEGPISRAINLIHSVQENIPIPASQTLEKVLEILKSELISQNPMSPDPKLAPADPVATDLLGGLLAYGQKSISSGTRRFSTDQFSSRQASGRSSLPNLPHMSNSIRKHLEKDLDWDFDVIRLERISDNKPLVWLGTSLFCKFNVASTLNTDEKTIKNWFTLIEANYHAQNSYHNSTHASDVLQASAFFLRQERVRALMDPLDVAACLIAAAVHDVDHPGKNSQYLCNTRNPLAIMYNDASVLESHHAAKSFSLALSDDRVNIFKGLDAESYKSVRKSIIDMVLATDMSKHFDHLAKFSNVLDVCQTPRNEQAVSSVSESGTELDLTLLAGESENIDVVLRMLIKCADINNPVRPLNLCKEWAYRIANEYFDQTESEKRLNLPIVMPQFDRSTCSIPKSQIGFVDFFVSELFHSWNELLQVPDLIDNLNTNYEYWKEEETRPSSNQGIQREFSGTELEHRVQIEPIEPLHSKIMNKDVIFEEPNDD